MRPFRLVLALMLALAVAGCTPAGEGQSASQPVSSSVDTPVKPAGPSVTPATPATPAGNGSDTVQSEEAPTKPISFRPDLILVLGEPRESGEAFGYSLKTGALEPLTTGSPGLLVWDVQVSPDGRLFRYFRTRPHATKPERICIRSVTGGESKCYSGPLEGGLHWRPGTAQLWDSGPQGKPSQILDAAGASITFTPLPFHITYGMEFNADGSELWFENEEGLWRTRSASPQDARRIPVDSIYSLTWAGKDKLAIVEKDYDRPGKLTLVDAEGKVNRVGRAPGNAGDGWAINGVSADPTGRYIAVDYGSSGSTWRQAGAAIYDLKSGQWRDVGSDGGPYVIGWIGQGNLLLKAKDRWFLYQPATTKRQDLTGVPAGDFLGASSDGDWLLLKAEGVIHLYQVSTGKVRQVETGGRRVMEAVWVP